MNRKRNIPLFILFVLLSGWFGKGIDTLLTGQPKGQSLGSLIWLIAPAFFSLLLVRFATTESRSLGIRLFPITGRTGNWKIYLFSLLFFPSVAAILLFLGFALNIFSLNQFSVSEFFSFIGIWFVISFFRTILEEIAWQGYLAEGLLQQKQNDWVIYAIVTLVWATWHIPYYLFFYQGENPVELIIGCYWNLACFSILFTEAYRVTNKIWPCVILHATSNVVQYMMLNDFFISNQKWDLFFAPGTGLISSILCITAGLFLRYRRLQKQDEKSTNG